jgi:hypothetical protein
MRRLAAMPVPGALVCSALALCTLASAGCGSSSKPAWQGASTCLRPLGTFFDHGRPLSLPFRNPFGDSPTQMASPKVFERELELSYPSDAPGANAAAFFFFNEDTDAKRVLKRVRSTPSFFPTGNLETIGPAIVRWSSNPAPKQRAAVAGCLAE